MKVLIVYESIPESTDLYIVDASESEVEFLKLCHGNYQNVADDEKIVDALDKLFILLGSPEWMDQEDCERLMIPVADASKWHGCKFESSEQINIAEHKIEMVIVTGFYM